MCCENCYHYKRNPDKCRNCDEGSASYLNYRPIEKPQMNLTISLKLKNIV